MGSGQVASVFALYSYDPSSNTAEVFSVFLSEAGDGSFKKTIDKVITGRVVERSLPTPVIRGSNPGIINYYHMY